MASTKLMETKDGKRFYKISVSRGYGVTPYTTRWYIPDGWSKKTIDRELSKVAAEFELKCSNGEVETRKDANERKAKEEAEARKILTVRQYAEQIFMPDLSVTCSESTRYNFTLCLNKHVFPAIGDIRIKDVEPEQISKMLLSLQAPADKEQKPLKYASVIKCYTVINMLFKKAYITRKIAQNPMDFVPRPKPTKAEGKEESTVKAFDEKTLVFIMSCLKKEPFKWQVFIRMLIDTGCRCGEICGLKWQSVNAHDKCITIESTLAYTPKNGKIGDCAEYDGKGIYADTTKTGKKRTIYVSTSIIDMLNDLRKMQMASGHPSEYVFTQNNSALPMHPQSPTRYLKKFGERYDIEDVHPHKFRHTFASVAITHGADIASVSAKLGHANISTTLDMYTHANDEAQRKASDIFRNALSEAQ